MLPFVDRSLRLRSVYLPHVDGLAVSIRNQCSKVSMGFCTYGFAHVLLKPGPVEGRSSAVPPKAWHPSFLFLGMQPSSLAWRVAGQRH